MASAPNILKYLASQLLLTTVAPKGGESEAFVRKSLQGAAHGGSLPILRDGTLAPRAESNLT